MAEGLNLATLNIAVQATGVQQAQNQVDSLTNSVQQSGNTTAESTSRMGGAFSGLGANLKNTIGQTQIFGTTLGNIGSAFSSAGGMATLMQGAVIGLTSALVQMAAQALQKAIAGLGKFVQQGVELASDLDEIQNVLDSAFGDSAEVVNDWSTTVASAYGLTELQAKQFASTTGAILNGMNITGDQAVKMSEQVAQLTGDMASFYNLDHDVAFDKIKAGLTGETEPLKALGIVMNETNLSVFAMEEGLDKAYSKMSESEKVILRYNYLINQTSLSHGDFAKTQEFYANVSSSLENNLAAMSAKMGETLLPALTQAKTILNDLVIAMAPIMTYLTQLISSILGNFVSAMQPAIAIIKVLMAIIKPIYELMSDILAKLSEIVNKVYGSIASVVTKFAEAMGIIQKNTTETAEYTTETIVNETKNALGYVDTAIDKWVNDQTKKYREKLESRYGDSLGSYVKIEKLTQQYEERRRSLAESYSDAYKKSQEDLTRGTKTEIDKQYSLYENYYNKLKNLFSGTKSADITGVAGWVNSDKAYATGTLYHPGGLAMVGENGRELIDLPRGSRVYTNRETENVVSGAGNTGQIINNYYATIDASTVKDFVDVSSAFSSYTQNTRMG